MKPVLTDEIIHATTRASEHLKRMPSDRYCYTLGEVERIARDIERMTRERMMELVCLECGGTEFDSADGHGLFCPPCKSMRIGVRAEYLRREGER